MWLGETLPAFLEGGCVIILSDGDCWDCWVDLTVDVTLLGAGFIRSGVDLSGFPLLTSFVQTAWCAINLIPKP